MVRPTSPLFTLSALLALCLANVAAKTGGGGIRGVRALVRLRIFAFMKSRRNLCRIEFEQYQVGTTYAESNRISCAYEFMAKLVPNPKSALY